MASSSDSVIANHYNARPNAGIAARKSSPIFHMRAFNNWIKYTLITTYVKAGDDILDLCGGKGGDLSKWYCMDVHRVVLVDIASESVKEAENRYRDIVDRRKCDYEAEFHTANCCVEDLTTLYAEDCQMFDVVSCQFALHYSFESEAYARRLLKNATDRLKPGGYFFGTIPCAYQLVHRVQAAPSKSFGNSIYTVTFDDDLSRTTLDNAEHGISHFGIRYIFRLVDAIDDCPEYLVHFEVFKKLCSEYGLNLVSKSTFHDQYKNHKKNSQSKLLLKNMRVFDESGSISADEWEAVGIYCTFVFQKN